MGHMSAQADCCLSQCLLLLALHSPEQKYVHDPRYSRTMPMGTCWAAPHAGLWVGWQVVTRQGLQCCLDTQCITHTYGHIAPHVLEGHLLQDVSTCVFPFHLFYGNTASPSLKGAELSDLVYFRWRESLIVTDRSGGSPITRVMWL